MNINERKHTSPSPRASQPIVDENFVHSYMDFVVKFLAANVSLSVLKALLYDKIVLQGAAEKSSPLKFFAVFSATV